jgi:hypothetical protein
MALRPSGEWALASGRDGVPPTRANGEFVIVTVRVTNTGNSPLDQPVDAELESTQVFQSDGGAEGSLPPFGVFSAAPRRFRLHDPDRHAARGQSFGLAGQLLRHCAPQAVAGLVGASARTVLRRAGSPTVPLRDVVDVAGHHGLGHQAGTWPPLAVRRAATGPG